MCGRYASFREAQDLADAFDVEDVTAAAREVAANYNVAPTDAIRVVVDRVPKGTAGADHASAAAAESGSDAAAEAADAAQAPLVRREMHLARWGLVPGWAKEPSVGSRMFNARSESLAEKSSFRKPLETKRCLVLADGYYEWLTTEVPGEKKPRKTPFFIHPADGAPIAFAGLYSWWPDPSKAPDDPDRWLLSATIVTAAARDGLEQIHDREPSMLTRESADIWLNPEITDPAEALAVLAAPAPALEWFEVSSQVNSVRNNGAALLDAV